MTHDEQVKLRNELTKHMELPPRFAAAWLEDKPKFHPKVWEACGKYLLNWPELNEKGTGLSLMGDSGMGKSHAAAALARGIKARYYPNHSFSVVWLSVAADIPNFLELRRAGSESCYARFRSWLDADLLIVDDLLQVADFPQHKEYLFAIAARRYDHLKPTITTANTLDPDDIKRALNAGFLRRLSDTSMLVTAEKKDE